MKSRSNLHLLAIGPMVWVEFAILFSLAFVSATRRLRAWG